MSLMLPCVFMQLNGIEHSMTCVICLQGDSLHRPFADDGNAFPGGTFPRRMFSYRTFLTLRNHFVFTQLYVNGVYLAHSLS